jgi:hypothetical protein
VMGLLLNNSWHAHGGFPAGCRPRGLGRGEEPCPRTRHAPAPPDPPRAAGWSPAGSGGARRHRRARPPRRRAAAREPRSCAPFSPCARSDSSSRSTGWRARRPSRPWTPPTMSASGSSRRRASLARRCSVPASGRMGSCSSALPPATRAAVVNMAGAPSPRPHVLHVEIEDGADRRPGVPSPTSGAFACRSIGSRRGIRRVVVAGAAGSIPVSQSQDGVYRVGALSSRPRRARDGL